MDSAGSDHHWDLRSALFDTTTSLTPGRERSLKFNRRKTQQLPLQKEQAQNASVPLEKSDVATSLIPFRMVLDETGHPLAWSGEINNLPPELPPGVLDFVRQNGEDRITWQPAPGVRLAAVIVKAGGSHPGFIVAARSLREVEKREDQVLLLAGLGMLVTLFLSLFAVIADQTDLQKQ